MTTTANIRSGPGLEYPVVDQAQSGESITVVACNEDCSWLQLDNGRWIAAFLVNLVVESNEGTTGSRTRTVDSEDVVLSEPSEAALEVVAEILAYAGLPQSFDLYSANIYNAAALMSNGKRVILYDPRLIADIEEITDHDWPAVSILAHEIGHHLAGHTLAESYNRNFELEADYFSGFILQKMGATLPEAQSVMSLLRDHPNMTDHPPQTERLAAIQEGWQEAQRQESLAAWQPSFAGFDIEAAWETEPLQGAGITRMITTLQRARSQQLATTQLAATQRAWPSGQSDWNLGLRAFAR